MEEGEEDKEVETEVVKEGDIMMIITNINFKTRKDNKIKELLSSNIN